MKGIINALWNYPSALAGALQAVNAILAVEGTIPGWASISVACVAAIATYAVVEPANPR